MSSAHLWRVAVAVLLSLLLTGCFEPPVSESVYLKFLSSSDGVVVGATVQLGSVRDFQDSAAARARIEAMQRDLAEERDPWSRRFRRLEPALERLVWDRAEGSLTRLTRRAYAEDPETLRAFFGDSLIEARFSAKESERELTLVAGSGSRASRSQREDLRGAMDPWMEALGRYLQAGSDLYLFLEKNPGQAPQAFEAVFGDGNGAADANRSARDTGASSEATALAKRLKDSLEEVLMAFQVGADSGISLEELSSLVYDPFPAPLTVQVPGKVLEVEGFRTGEQGLLEAGGASLLATLKALEGKWIDPDPLLTEFRALQSGAAVDAQAFARRPRRRSAPPTATELRHRVEEALTGPQLYRVRWSAPAAAENHAVPDDRESLWKDPS